jgi:predicted permease
MMNVDLGFNPQYLLAFELASDNFGMTDQTIRQQIKDEVSKIPQVESAALGTWLPLWGGGIGTSFTIETESEGWTRDLFAAHVQSIDPGYFHTMEIPILSGRDFTGQEWPNSHGVVIINRLMAQKFWPRQGPIGKRIDLNGIDPKGSRNYIEIVGVVENVQSGDWSMPLDFQVYFPANQWNFSNMHSLLIRTSSKSAISISLIQDRIKSIDKTIDVFRADPMQRIFDECIQTPRLRTTLLGIFAGFAFLLTLLSVYGATAYSVSQRIHEIGIHLSLGAQAFNVVWMVLVRNLLAIAVGVCGGICGAFALTRFLSGLLFEVKPNDALTFLVVPALLAVIAIVASYIPARQAVKINPKDLLNSE